MNKHSDHKPQLSPLIQSHNHETHDDSDTGPVSVTSAIIFTTLVAVSGSYVFGTAVSALRLPLLLLSFLSMHSHCTCIVWCFGFEHLLLAYGHPHRLSLDWGTHQSFS